MPMSYRYINDNIVLEVGADSAHTPVKLIVRNDMGAIHMPIDTDAMKRLAYALGLTVYERVREVPMDPSWGSGRKVKQEIDERDHLPKMKKGVVIEDAKYRIIKAPPVETSSKRRTVKEEAELRFKVALYAYAYEIESDSLVSDTEFDRLAAMIDPKRVTGDVKLDRFFAKEFAPHTGSWVHAYPYLKQLAKAYREHQATQGDMFKGDGCEFCDGNCTGDCV